MNVPSNTSAVDFNRMAASVDRYLYLIEPVGVAVLSRLPRLPEAAEVLDVACGSGEPGLTLARRLPHLRLRLLGIDTASAMVELARAKASRENLTDVRFEVMAAEALTQADESVDAVVSRFGLMMFGDPQASAEQLMRVLRPNGAFSLAVWCGLGHNTLVRTVVAALRPHLPVDLLAPFDQVAQVPVAQKLAEVGLASLDAENFRWSYNFPSQNELWQFVSVSGLFGRQFAGLDDVARTSVRQAIVADLASFCTESGTYIIPHQCLLLAGRRPPKVPKASPS